MAEFFAVLGAAQQCASILSSFANLVSRYRSLPDELLDVKQGVAAVHAGLDYWRQKWDVRSRPGHPESYYKHLFGSMFDQR
jgi:hypothetical protein